MPSVLITGVSGFVGGAIARELLSQDWRVVGLSRRGPSDMPGSLEFCQADLADASAMSRIDVSGFDAIIHAAAHTHLEADLSAESYVSSNVTGAINLRDLARCCGVARIVNFSTISVYGGISTDVLTESTPFSVPHLYGATKYLAELILADEHDLRVATLRLPGVVGPGYTKPWLGKMLRAAQRDEQITVSTPAQPFNNIVDTMELARLCRHLVLDAGEWTGVVNVGSASPVPVIDVVRAIVRLVESGSGIVASDEARPAFQIDTECLRNQIGFAPEDTMNIVERYVHSNPPDSKKA